jgi:hypothetical protein
MIKYTVLFLLLAAGATMAAIGFIDPEYLGGYTEIGMAIARLLLVLGVGLAVLWWRNLRVVAETEAAEEPLPDATPQPVVRPVRAMPAPTLIHSRDDKPSADIEVCDSVSDVEQARLLLGFGRWRDAGKALVAVAPRPAESVGYQIARLNRGMEFGAERSGRPSVLPPFNVAWSATGGQEAPHLSLEDFPHVMTAIEKHWGRFACAVYLDFLLLDTRDGKRAGFPLAVAEEIVLLRRVLDERLREDPAAGPKPVSGIQPAAIGSFSWELRCVD